MNAEKIPVHATLPLWSEKSDAQKWSYLEHLALDLKIYAGFYGQHFAEAGGSDLFSSPDLAYVEMMKKYDLVLGGMRSQLLAFLEQAVPFDDSEYNSLLEARELISSNPNIMNMSCEAGHVTGSGLVVDVEKELVLLHLHRKLGRWFQFGGHPDYETSVLDIAMRETKEESGLKDLQVLSSHSDISVPIDIDLQVIPQSRDRPVHKHIDLRYIFSTSNSTDLVATNGESDNFWWLDFDNALSQPDHVIDASVKRLIIKARHRLIA